MNGQYYNGTKETFENREEHNGQIGIFHLTN